MDNKIVYLQSHDLGLQAERTVLAWNRTVLAAFANSIIIFRSGIIEESLPLVILSIVCVCAAAWLWFLGKIRIGQINNLELNLDFTSTSLWVISLASVILCAAGLITVVIHSIN